MAAHRYWRARGLEVWGAGALALSEFQLRDSAGRVDAAATLTASIAPSSGALADLKDDNTATGATWASPIGLVLQWDFGGGTADVVDVRIGAADTRATFLQAFGLQWSDNATTWADAGVFAAIQWPGARTKTSSDPLGYWSLENRAPLMAVSPDRRTAGPAPGGTGVLADVEAERSSGVRQFEVTISSTEIAAVGVASAAANVNTVLVNDANFWGAYINGGAFKSNGAGSAVYAGWSTSGGNVVGCVVDFTAGTITFYRNGVSAGVAYSNLAGKTVRPAFAALNTILTRPVTLRTQGFVYPIAGATPWQEGERLRVDPQGAMRTRAPVRKDSAATIVLDYRRTRYLPGLIPARKDYVLSGLLGAGIGRVKGTTKDKGTPNVPVSERVRLHKQRDGLVVREVWSAPGTGAYSFDWIDEGETYYVVSFDKEGSYRAVLADGLTLANGGVELIA